ncbi:MAG: hypothetical protein K2Y40_12570 [Reyranella sp.]|nr:hypothetical protein [Reyranella sp.]
MPPSVALKPLPFAEAVAFFDQRAANLVPSDRWTDLWQEEHAVGFTVARSVGYDILGDIRDALREAIGKGETFESFAKRLRPVLQEKGWWGRVQRADGEVVQLGSMRRLRTIFDMNVRVSYSAGAWERAQRTKRALPYILYVGILDGRIRPVHESWHGTCLPIDHEWWDTHWCPCGWRCRCQNRQVTRLEAQRIGITQRPPSGPPRRWFNPNTGETIEVPHGIDPGFGYNVGKAALEGKARGDAAKVMADKMAATPPQVAAVPVPPQILGDLSAEFARWLDDVDYSRGDMRVVGALPAKVLDFLATPAIGRRPESGAIVITDHAVKHIMRQSKGALRPSIDTMRRLPELMARPAAILWDRDKRNLVWVIELQDDRGTRLIVDVDRLERTRDVRGKRQAIRTNVVVSGQLVNVQALRDARRYELVDGRL